jgi:N-acetylglucosamine kinase-like BadF-type ATPase
MTESKRPAAEDGRANPAAPVPPGAATPPGPPAAVLAIDGGNSKTELALVAADGTLLAQVRGGRSNFQGIGMNEAFAVLRAGLDDAGEPEHWGVGVTCGAGINCVGVAPDGATTRFLSLGEISGDWGGGGSLAGDTLWWAARAEDGRGPQTDLAGAVAAHFGLATVRDVTIGCYRREITRQQLHGLVPVLFEVASRGDRVASDLVLRQADEICVMAATAARRLDLTGAPVPVIVGGSVVTARNPLLVDRLTERLTAELPHARLRIVDVPPVAGAALLGLDRAGAGPAAAERLRSFFAGLRRVASPADASAATPSAAG